MVLTPKIESLSVGAAGVVVRFVDGLAVEAATEWIRDACRCHACRDQHTGQHSCDVSELSDWEVVRAVVIDDDLTVDLVRSSDAHRVRVDGDAVRRLASSQVPIRCTWTGLHRDELVGSARSLPAAERVDELAKDLVRYGIALGSQLEPVDRAVLKLAHALGFVRETVDGEIFDLRTADTDLEVTQAATGRAFRTATPYREAMPAVQVLHCLRPAAVHGVSRFADGFAAVEYLRAAEPDAFACLATTIVEFRFSSPDVDLRARRCIIEADPAGVVRSLHMDHQSMEPPILSGAAARRFYDAYRRLSEVVQDPANVVEVPFGLGDVVVFDSRRVLVARTGNSRTEPRHVQGCCIDVDAVESLARINERTRTRPRFTEQQLF